MTDTVSLAPFARRDMTLAGFVMSGRWPQSTREWAQVLLMAVRLAAVPGFVPTTSLFLALDEVPDEPAPVSVGMLTNSGPLLGDAAPRPGSITTPPALFVLHPPDETRPSTPEAEGAASGCLLLPGLPHLGIEHRAAWVEAESDGTVTKLVSSVGVRTSDDIDLAVMAALLAA
ncbi:MAG: peptidase [Jiangellales bacterium]